MHPPCNDSVSGTSPGEPLNAVDSRVFPASARVGGRAFTLVEMLVVMGVILTLMAVTVPVFKNLVGGRPVEQSINSVTSLLELGRATAIAHRTRVWVLISNSTNSDNNAELKCAVVMSLNGLNSFGATTDDVANMGIIGKLVKIPNIKNVKYTQMPKAVQKVTPTELQTDGAYIAGYYNPEGTSKFPKVVIDGYSFLGATFIGFFDDGEIGTSADDYGLLVQPVTCIGLAKTVGTTVQTTATDGAIVACYGGSTKMRVFRP